MKHGMSGTGSVRPEDMDAEVLAELEIFNRQHRPRNLYEQRLVEEAALTQVRKNRLLKAELVLTAENARMALERREEARAAEVADHIERLAREPGPAVAGLRRSTEGCEWLADAWDDLDADLKRFGHWDDAQGRLALSLLGLTAPPRADRNPVLADVWSHAYALLCHADLATIAARQNRTPESLAATLPDRATALAVVATFVARQIADLEARAQTLWERRDRPTLAGANDHALFDPSPEFARLMRYLADANRLQKRALAELERLRKQDARDRRDPARPALPTPEPDAPLPSPINHQPSVIEDAEPVANTTDYRETASGEAPSPSPTSPSVPPFSRNEPGAPSATPTSPNPKPSPDAPPPTH